jgi:cyclic-di-AMP phosphodiesterase PgpH
VTRLSTDAALGRAGDGRGFFARDRLRGVIPRRPKVGPATALLLALGFALATTAVIRIDTWLTSADGLAVVAGEPSPVTVRVPPFAGGADGFTGGSVLIARGEVATAEVAHQVAAVRARNPHGAFGDLAFFVVVFVLALIYALHLRRSNRGRYLRTQAVLLGAIVIGAAVIKTAMLLTAVSVLAAPVALLALVAAMTVDRDSGVATGVLASVVVGLLVPFDIGVTAILLIQALTASLFLPDRIRRRWRVAFATGLAAAVSGLLAYGIVHYLTRGSAPVHELADPSASSWLAAGVGGLFAAFFAVPAVPALQVACGEITDGALITLEDLSHPLLRQIADKAPGTWQHSLAMANMAEIAANAIGANGRLVRVGAYFHDLGKSLQPKYFIENVESGEQSPHDRLPPDVSCDAIFAHVTEGIALARRHGLPDRIIDFMHMHHGDGVLEYFWAKCQEQGNPGHLTSEDFRYPGVPPQSRETAILAICDAVEAASRTLRRPDQKAIDSLVQRIVYGKLHLGQLDESGLSMADLRRVNDSLRETIKHAHHGRIEYPWQREERAREAETQAARPPPAPARDSITQRMMEEPRLDSLDAPRPPWAAGGSGLPRAQAGDAAEAPTVPVTTPSDLGTPGGEARTLSLRPHTALLADSVDVAHAATAELRALRDERATSPAPAADAIPGADAAPAADPATTQPALTASAAPAAEPVPTAEAAPAPAPSSAPAVAPTPPWSGTFAAAAEEALTTGAPPRPTSRTPWGTRIADRIDALLEPESGEAAADDADADAQPPAELVADAVDEAADARPPAVLVADAVDDTADARPTAVLVDDAVDDTAAARPPAELVDDDVDDPDDARPPAVLVDDEAVPRPADLAPPPRRQPPPPPRPRRLHTTQEVDGDDVEATIEIAPSVASRSGPIVGPPPATRPAPPPRFEASPPEDDGDLTVVPTRPPSSMLPPRARTHGKPRE